MDDLNEKLERWFYLYTRTYKTRKERMLFNEMKREILQQHDQIEMLNKKIEGLKIITKVLAKPTKTDITFTSSNGKKPGYMDLDDE